MVPGSTFKYGSHFWRVTRRPRLSSKQPIDAAATPLPSEETTPPVTNIYFGPIRSVPAANFTGYRTGFNPPGRCWRTTHSTEKAVDCQRAARSQREKFKNLIKDRGQAPWLLS